MATDPLKSTSWWHSLGVGQGPDEAEGQTAPDTDYADMGTAFGLDASMNPPSAPGSESKAPESQTGRADPDAPRK